MTKVRTALVIGGGIAGPVAADPRAAFAAYERRRRPRVERIAARAAKVNHVKAPGPLTSALLPVLMRLMTKTVMRPEKALGPEQRYRIDWDTAVQSEKDTLRVR
ncbi:hypothetical protein [Gandjariella thermophila]|uniref:FAD-binding domain-containing protein n=1 Tax=Gandjariella thermophila TaxID=1931992 RepID=A0A4D4JCM1_9PSEU|nr:hypothetical protein [Gandjariella thermophila]GDY31647.1 hypothetical protein GTS_32800 [Gandjariella thermophila]